LHWSKKNATDEWVVSRSIFYDYECIISHANNGNECQVVSYCLWGIIVHLLQLDNSLISNGSDLAFHAVADIPKWYDCVYCRHISCAVRRWQAGSEQGSKQSFSNKSYNDYELFATLWVQIWLHICGHETVQSSRGKILLFHIHFFVVYFSSTAVIPLFSVAQ
jgi:hypothetical protein